MIIYRAVNKINGKTYIGQTTKDLEVRKRQHEYDALRNSLQIFHKALRNGVCKLEICSSME